MAIGPVELSAQTPDDGSPRARDDGGASVEKALASAIMKAAEASRWDVVAQLARELEARRLAAAEAVKIDPSRRRP